MSDEHPSEETPATSDQVLSDYLLGELDPADRDRIERLLSADSALRSRAQRLAPLVAQLQQLSPDAWRYVGSQSGAHPTGLDAPARPRPVGAEDRASGGDRAPQAPSRRSRWWRRPLAMPPALAAMAAGALLAIGVGVGVLIERTPAPGGTSITLRALPGESPGTTAHARITPNGDLVLIVHNLPASRSGTYYEAWLMTDATRLVPIAAFRTGAHGSAQINVPLPASASSYRYIDISLQHAGAGTAHSRQSVLRGET